jgi:putative transposase
LRHELDRDVIRYSTCEGAESEAWGNRIEMDGKGAWRDNVFVERLWRSVKYEEVYLRAYESVCEARNSIGRYLDFYNRRRPHSSLDDSTPDQAYFNPLPLRLAA